MRSFGLRKNQGNISLGILTPAILPRDCCLMMGTSTHPICDGVSGDCHPRVGPTGMYANDRGYYLGIKPPCIRSHHGELHP